MVGGEDSRDGGDGDGYPQELLQLS